jgi:hypothetical protein
MMDVPIEEGYTGSVHCKEEVEVLEGQQMGDPELVHREKQPLVLEQGQIRSNAEVRE